MITNQGPSLLCIVSFVENKEKLLFPCAQAIVHTFLLWFILKDHDSDFQIIQKEVLPVTAIIDILIIKAQIGPFYGFLLFWTMNPQDGTIFISIN